MTDMEKINKLADILDKEPDGLTADVKLDEIGWDSMGMLSVIALARANGRTITGAQVRDFETVGDILLAAF